MFESINIRGNQQEYKRTDLIPYENIRLNRHPGSNDTRREWMSESTLASISCCLRMLRKLHMTRVILLLIAISVILAFYKFT